MRYQLRYIRISYLLGTCNTLVNDIANAKSTYKNETNRGLYGVSKGTFRPRNVSGFSPFRPERFAILGSMESRGPRIIRRVIWSIVVLIFAAGAFVACQERQTIRDYFDGREFKPTAEMQTVITNIELTDSGRRIFLATHPAIESADEFNDRCRNAETEHSGHLLGCYANGKIHLFSVTDERLESVVEVTAAHELMHAAYARLSTAERDALATKLNRYYSERIKTDPDFEKRMEVYASLSASQFANELHSIFATEVRDLPDWLEEHYSAWLADRDAVVTFYDTYQGVFTTVEQEAKALKERLDTMHESLEGESASYTSDVEAFNADWKSFVARNDAYEFSDNEAEFNRLKRDFDDRRGNLEHWKNTLQESIHEYERLSSELASLGELSLELNNQIDSTVPTAE